MIIRPFTCFCATLAIVSGFFLYTKKHQTALLDQKIISIIRQTKHLQAQTDTLRTEWTLENQPDRLEQLTYRYAPYLHVMNPSQFVRLSDLEDQLPAPKGITIRHKRHQDLTPPLTSNHQFHDTSHGIPEAHSKLLATNSNTNHILTSSAFPLRLLSKDTPSKNIVTAQNASDVKNIKKITLPVTTTLPSSPSHTVHLFSVPHTHDFTTIGIPADIHRISTPRSVPIVVANETLKPIHHSLPIAAVTWHFVRKRKVIDQPQTESHTAYFKGSVFNHETKLLPPPVPILK